MIKFLVRYADYVYSLLRMVAGFLFACHGAQKLFGMFGGETPLDHINLAAGAIEFFGGILITLGLAANLAAFIASIEMAVVYFGVYAPHGPLPIQNGGERVVLFCFFFFYVALKGAGPLSFDSMFGRHLS